jgi:TetR/AcrR family fatty acid metabolism transcriptional regulator
MASEVYADVRRFYSQLLVILEEGKANGEIRPDLNSRLARDIFVGTMDHLITRWLLKERSYSIFENLEEVFDLLVNALGGQERAKPAPERTSTGQTTGWESPQAEPVAETDTEPNNVEA